MIVVLRQAGFDAPIHLHGALEQLAPSISGRGSISDRCRRSAESPEEFKGALVLCPPSELAGRWSRRLSDPLTAFASGWMRVRAKARQRGVELPLVVSDHADWPELIDTIAETGASEVWVTHGREDALVHALTIRGLTARALSLVGPGRGWRWSALRLHRPPRLFRVAQRQGFG